MAKELQQTLPEARRKRVQRLKKMIIGIVAAGIVIPLLCCVYLICRLHTIDGTLKTLEQRLDELDIRNQELQTLLQQLQEQKSTPVQTPQIQEDSPGAEASEPVAEESFGQEEIHKVYLTFDDGPSIYTNDILDILDSYNVKATFFVVGKEGTNAEEALQRIVDEGHTLGMHSYSHKYKELYESMDSFTQDFARIRDSIYQATGVESVCYRFPGGSSNTISEIDMHDFIDYLDSQGVEYIRLECVLRRRRKHEVIHGYITGKLYQGYRYQRHVYHTVACSAEKPTTVEALPDIIENILGPAGYSDPADYGKYQADSSYRVGIPVRRECLLRF